VRVRRDVAVILRTLAQAEKVAISEVAQAALYAWSQHYRPEYGAALNDGDLEQLKALLTRREPKPKEPTKKPARKATTKRR
jgi:hypothetical protein